MGLTAPNGQNCTIRSFVTGGCLQALITQYKKFGWKWNAANRSRPASAEHNVAAEDDPAEPDRPPASVTKPRTDHRAPPQSGARWR